MQPSDNGVENEARAGGAQKVGRTDYLAPLLAHGRKWEKIAVERAEREERDTLDPSHRELETAFDRPTNRCRRHSALLRQLTADEEASWRTARRCPLWFHGI